MKFKGSIDINRPLDKVAELFAAPQYLGKYQEGFLRKTYESGRDGEDGSISKMYYQYGKQEMEITETIINNRLPNSLEAHYHHVHMDNTMKYSFTALNEVQTRYEYECEYTRINWFMPKLISILFPGLYKKQVDKWMNNFKMFAETK